jgi:transcriptional regulator with XRE-family HTH domain
MRKMMGVKIMRIRKQALGDRNIVGAKIEQQRKSINMKQKDLLTQLQIKGIDLNASGLSKLEGQLRYVTDFELKALAEVLGVTVNWMLEID